MKIVEEEVKEYCLVYDDVHGSGYSFPCDEGGRILWEEFSSKDAAEKSLAYCKAHLEMWTGKCGEIVAYVSHYRYGICPHCGLRVYFWGAGWSSSLGVSQCDCGHWYNIFGQEMRPPEDWEDVDEDLDDWEEDYTPEDWEDFREDSPIPPAEAWRFES